MTPTRFRYSLASRAAGVIFAIAVVALAGQGAVLLVLLVVPAVLLAYLLRSGVDVDTESIRVRALVGSRTVPWSAVTGVDRRGNRVALLVDDARSVQLPPLLRPADVPRLLAAGGQAYDATGAHDATGTGPDQ